MLRKTGLLVFSILVLLSTSGCFALFAGAAGGAGTAVWLSGKLTQEVNASMERSQQAAKQALEALSYDIDKETVKYEVTQIISKDSEQTTAWVDIHRVSDTVSRIEVRVGVKGDKEAARKILDKIISQL